MSETPGPESETEQQRQQNITHLVRELVARVLLAQEAIPEVRVIVEDLVLMRDAGLTGSSDSEDAIRELEAAEQALRNVARIAHIRARALIEAGR